MKLNVNDRRDLTDKELFSGPRLLVSTKPAKKSVTGTMMHEPAPSADAESAGKPETRDSEALNEHAKTAS